MKPTTDLKIKFRRVLITSFLFLLSDYAFAHRANGYLAHGPGGLGFALEYERDLTKYASWGGFLHNYAGSDDGIGLGAAGAFYRPYLRRGPFLFYMKVGLGGYNIAFPDESKFAIGPMYSVGFEVQSSKLIHYHFAQVSYHGWFSEPSGELLNSVLIGASYFLPAK
ncbi:MAG: hypothetical protein HRU19_13130 [Pseudobacteriovorax sp.]|nr:hypothetical protein [Pseudobacteriovorax sp.]